MKKNIQILLVSFLTCIFSSYSQKKAIKKLANTDGYEVVLTTKNLKDEKLQLYYLYDITKKKVIADSISISENEQRVIFKVTKKIIGAIYFIKLKSQNDAIQIALDNGSKIELSIDTKITNISCLSKNINKDFIDFQLNSDKLSKEEKINLRSNILKKYPNSILNLFFKIENKINESNPKDIESQLKYRNDFFASIDKNDKRIFLLPNIYKLLYNYIRSLPINNENYTKSIDLLLKGIPCSSMNYKIYTKWLVSNLSYYESENLESSYIHLYKNYIEVDKCNNFSDSDKNKNNNTYLSILKNPMNSKIPDFTMIDKDSTSYTLSKIYPENDYTFIAFFSPTCHHCEVTMPQAQAAFENIKNKYPTKKIKLISILNDTDESKWEQFVLEKNISNWLNLKSVDPKKAYQEDFNSYSNPKFFLIDKNGKILLKSLNAIAIEGIIK
jgi:thiol-disulfide isomerase/thioredoxin